MHRAPRTVPRASRSSARPRVLLSWEWGLALSPAIETAEHAHHAIEIVVDLAHRTSAGHTSAGRTSAIVADRHLVGPGLVVGPRQPHRLAGARATRCSILTGPLTPIGHHLRRYLAGRPARALPQPWVDQLLRRLLPGVALGTAHTALAGSIAQLPAASPPPPSDPRVLGALQILRRDFDEPHTVGSLARSVHLSERRLGQIFRRDVGMPVRSYRRWLRVRAGTRLALRGWSLTAAAHEVGFTDLAAFSKTFKRSFGCPPSVLQRWSPTFQEIDEPRPP